MKAANLIEPDQDDQEFAAQAVRQWFPKSRRQANVIHYGRAESPESALLGEMQKVPLAVVPAHIAELFHQILVEVASGKAVTIVPHDKMLTTQDAADLLNISRPFLIKLLEKEKVKIQKVGNRRRIAFQDVLELKQKMRKQSEEAFNRLAEIDEEIGLDN
jgi:excisionase family DNA binding protein